MLGVSKTKGCPKMTLEAAVARATATQGAVRRVPSQPFPLALLQCLPRRQVTLCIGDDHVSSASGDSLGDTPPASRRSPRGCSYPTNLTADPESSRNCGVSGPRSAPLGLDASCTIAFPLLPELTNDESLTSAATADTGQRHAPWTPASVERDGVGQAGRGSGRGRAPGESQHADSSLMASRTSSAGASRTTASRMPSSRNVDRHWHTKTATTTPGPQSPSPQTGPSTCNDGDGLQACFSCAVRCCRRRVGTAGNAARPPAPEDDAPADDGTCTCGPDGGGQEVLVAEATQRSRILRQALGSGKCLAGAQNDTRRHLRGLRALRISRLPSAARSRVIASSVLLATPPQTRVPPTPPLPDFT
ncbi:hypothetical protein B0H11DRAFT_2213531 [Mycena galericulata]|nr:hypothetical protein B0H11DRAFT_2213531 [Mycena galericulata]